MENIAHKYSHIKGWGIDADPENEPTYPMKNYTGDDHKRSDYEKAIPQKQTMEILKSNERQEVSRVFGTSVPPSGLSGSIRRYAFEHSESSYLHWLPLILADRVNMVEGVIDDLAGGKVPNIFAERGLKSEWKHNRGELLTKVFVVAAISAAFFTIAFKQRKKEKMEIASYEEELV